MSQIPDRRFLDIVTLGWRIADFEEEMKLRFDAYVHRCNDEGLYRHLIGIRFHSDLYALDDLKAVDLFVCGFCTGLELAYIIGARRPETRVVVSPGILEDVRYKEDTQYILTRPGVITPDADSFHRHLVTQEPKELESTLQTLGIFGVR